MLSAVPAGAQSDDESPAGEVIEQRGLLGEDTRMAEGVGENAMAEPAARHAMGECGSQRERLPTRSTSFASRVRQVVVHPDRLEHVMLADPRPGLVDGAPIDGLWRRLDPDVNDRHRAALTPAFC